MDLELGWHWFVMVGGTSAGTTPTGGTVSNQHPHALMIDDNRDNADLVRLRLVESNFHLETSYPGSAVESLMSSCHRSSAEYYWQDPLSLVPRTDRETEIVVHESFLAASDQTPHFPSFGQLVVGREEASSSSRFASRE
jgi:hypothetical protein